MASYKVVWKRSATKELRQLSGEARHSILQAVAQLAQTPYPARVRKLVATRHTYRIRVGDYRVIESVGASELVIEVVRIGHRKDVYH